MECGYAPYGVCTGYRVVYWPTKWPAKNNQQYTVTHPYSSTPVVHHYMGKAAVKEPVAVPPMP